MTVVVFTRIDPGSLLCEVPVGPGGTSVDSEGMPLPFSARTDRCGEPAAWLIGGVLAVDVPVCVRHLEETCALLETDVPA